LTGLTSFRHVWGRRSPTRHLFGMSTSQRDKCAIFDLLELWQ
jgi:hypothetical protein